LKVNVMKRFASVLMVFLYFTATVSIIGCSNGSGNSGDGIISDRQATLAAVSQLKQSSDALETAILELSPEDLNANPDLTGVLLKSAFGESLGFSSVGQSGSDVEFMIPLVASLMAKDAEEDLKSLMEHLQELLNSKKKLLDAMNTWQSDLKALQAALLKEAQGIARKQEAGGPIEFIDFRSFGSIHLSGLIDRGNVGGLDDLSPALVFDAGSGRFSARSDCGGNPGQTFLQIIDVFNGLEIDRATASGGVAAVELNLEQRTPVAVRVIARSLPYGLSFRCDLRTEYRRRADVPAVQYSADQISTLSDLFMVIDEKKSELDGGLATLVSDGVWGNGDLEAILASQNQFNTLTSYVNPTLTGPLEPLESVESLIGGLQESSDLAATKLQKLMQARSKSIMLITNILSEMNNTRGKIVQNLK
jgi:hypothetical protein